MASSNNNKGKAFSEMNVVPFIDIMLVLLIVFMITTPVINESVKVDLPKAKADKIEVSNKTPIVIISVDKDEKLYLSLNGSPIKVKTINDIKNEINKLSRSNKDAKIFLRGDEGSSYGSIMKVMTTLKSSKIDNIGLMTESNE
jgi:biopolymer transport protein TolR